MATLALGLAGSALGGALLPAGILGVSGASIGWAVGGLVAGALFGPDDINTQGPRLSDLKVTNSAHGLSIPFGYGTWRQAGNIFFSTDLVERATTQSVGGGKGGPPEQTQTTYSYSVSFALGICEGPITGIRRIWMNNELVYDNSGTELGGLFSQNFTANRFTIYTGGEDQQPDPKMQAELGVDVTPAYRGLAYLFFEGLELADFGNRIPNIEVEVVKSGEAFLGPRVITAVPIGYPQKMIQKPSALLAPLRSNVTFNNIANPDNVAPVGYLINRRFLFSGIQGETVKFTVSPQGSDLTNNGNDPDYPFYETTPLYNYTETYNGFIDTPTVTGNVPRLIGDHEVYVNYKTGFATGVPPQEADLIQKQQFGFYGIYRYSDVDDLRDPATGIGQVKTTDYGRSQTYGLLRDRRSPSKYTTFNVGPMVYGTSNWSSAVGPVKIFGQVSSITLNNASNTVVPVASEIGSLYENYYIRDYVVHDDYRHYYVLLSKYKNYGDANREGEPSLGFPHVFVKVDHNNGDPRIVNHGQIDISDLINNPKNGFLGFTYDDIFDIHLNTYPTLYTTTNDGLIWSIPASSTKLIRLRETSGLMTADIDNSYGSFTFINSLPSQNGAARLLGLPTDIKYKNGLLIMVTGQATVGGVAPKVQPSDDIVYNNAPTITYTYPDEKGGYLGQILYGIKIDNGGLVEEGQFLLSDVVADLCSRSGLDPTEYNVTELQNDIVKGFVIGQRMTVRNAIAPLMAGYFFDAVESGEEIRFNKRGKDPVETIDFNYVAATEGGENGEIVDDFIYNRGQEVELPQEVSLNYFSKNGDYREGTQYSRRLITKAVNKVNMDLPIVFDDSEALNISNTILFDAWQSRNRISFSTSRIYEHLEPTDNILLAKSGVTFLCRIVKKSDGGNGVINFEAVQEDLSIYGNDYQAEEVKSGVGFLSGSTTPETVYFNTRTLKDEYDVGQSVGVVGAYSFGSSFPGSRVFRSFDNENIEDTKKFLINQATFGKTKTILKQNPRLSFVNEEEFLEVTLKKEEMAFYSTTNDELFKGEKNLLLVGSEIIAFRDAEQIGVDTWRLSGLIRGLRGTHWSENTNNHEENEDVILLDKTIQPVFTERAKINSDQTIKALPQNVSFFSTFTTPIQADNTSLRPVAPIVEGLNYTDIGAVIKITRGSRIGHEITDYTDTPLGETLEKYLIRIYNEFDEVIREVETTETQYNISKDQLLIDFGQDPSSFVVGVSQFSSFVGFGDETKYTIKKAVTPFLPYHAFEQLAFQNSEITRSFSFAFSAVNSQFRANDGGEILNLAYRDSSLSILSRSTLLNINRIEGDEGENFYQFSPLGQTLDERAYETVFTNSFNLSINGTLLDLRLNFGPDPLVDEYVLSINAAAESSNTDSISIIRRGNDLVFQHYNNNSKQADIILINAIDIGSFSDYSFYILPTAPNLVRFYKNGQFVQEFQTNLRSANRRFFHLGRAPLDTTPGTFSGQLSRYFMISNVTTTTDAELILDRFKTASNFEAPTGSIASVQGQPIDFVYPSTFQNAEQSTDDSGNYINFLEDGCAEYEDIILGDGSEPFEMTFIFDPIRVGQTNITTNYPALFDSGEVLNGIPTEYRREDGGLVIYSDGLSLSIVIGSTVISTGIQGQMSQLSIYSRGDGIRYKTMNLNSAGTADGDSGRNVDAQILAPGVQNLVLTGATLGNLRSDRRNNFDLIRHFQSKLRAFYIRKP